MADTYSEPVGETWKYNPEYHEVADFLGVNKYDRDNLELATKLSTIRDWAGLQGKNNSTTEALTAMRALQQELGLPFIGKPLVDELYKTIRLKQDIARTQTPKQGESKKEKAEEKKDTSLEGAIRTAVQGVISNVVKEAVSDKSFMENAIQSTVKEAVSETT